MNEFEVDTKNKYTNGLIFKNETGFDLFIRNGEFFISGCENQTEADALIAAHNPTKPAEPTVAEKLASVGLNLDDLKVALGL